MFELSKVETPAIRARMVSHLLNVDADLAKNVADGLGLAPLPQPAIPARAVIKDLARSPKLSIVQNGPKDFKGRKIGALVTDGVDAALLAALMEAVAAEGALIEFVAPKVGGVVASDGTLIPAQQKIGGGPSVLYDAVAILPSAEGVALLAKDATAKDFINDAYAHAKFIAFSAAAEPLFAKIGLPAVDGGFLALTTPTDAAKFITLCRSLRFWAREPMVHAV